MAGLYLIDPNGRTGMLDDGTEVAVLPWSNFNHGGCRTCIILKAGYDACVLTNCEQHHHPDEIRPFGVFFREVKE